MTKGRIDKRQRQDDQRRMKRLQAAGAWLTADKVPHRPIVVGARRSRPSVGFVEAPPEPLPPHRYPTKLAQVGRRQVPGGN